MAERPVRTGKPQPERKGSAPSSPHHFLPGDDLLHARAKDAPTYATGKAVLALPVVGGAHVADGGSIEERRDVLSIRVSRAAGDLKEDAVQHPARLADDDGRMIPAFQGVANADLVVGPDE